MAPELRPVASETWRELIKRVWEEPPACAATDEKVFPDPDTPRGRD